MSSAVELTRYHDDSTRNRHGNENRDICDKIRYKSSYTIAILQERKNESPSSDPKNQSR